MSLYENPYEPPQAPVHNEHVRVKTKVNIGRLLLVINAIGVTIGLIYTIIAMFGIYMNASGK